MSIFGDMCCRCDKKRTKKSFEGVPTCETCQLQIEAERQAASEATRQCPIDSSVMKKEIVNNIIIDRCEKCGGVWLDSGELDVLKKAIQSGAGGDLATGMVLGMAIG